MNGGGLLNQYMIQVGKICEVIYDGTYWILQNPAIDTYYTGIAKAPGSYLYYNDIQGGDANLNIGYLSVPQNSQSAAYTMVLTDSAKHIYHPSADTTARIWTIPANSSVAYPIGTVLTFINDSSAGTITIAITTDTLIWAGPGTTGSRTLAANGIATAFKITATKWMINGTNLT